MAMSLINIIERFHNLLSVLMKSWKMEYNGLYCTLKR